MPSRYRPTNLLRHQLLDRFRFAQGLQASKLHYFLINILGLASFQMPRFSEEPRVKALLPVTGKVFCLCFDCSKMQLPS